MRLIRDSNKKFKEVLTPVSFASYEKFANFLVTYKESLLEDKYRLIKKEKQFLVATIVMYNRGININSKEARKLYITEFGFKTTRSVYDYRGFLVKKGWLSRVDGQLVLWDFFIFNKFSNEVSFIIDVTLNQDETIR